MLTCLKKTIHSSSGLVDSHFIKNYHEHREELTKKGRGKNFIDAVKQLEEYMSNRVVRSR